MLLAACAGPGGAPGGGVCGGTTEIASLKVFPTQLEVAAGETKSLATQAFNACGYDVTGFSVTWVSSDDAVARVNDAGRVTGVSGGSVRVTATLATGPGGTALKTTGLTGSASVTVQTVADPPPTTAFDIFVLPANPVVAAGESIQMTAIAVDGTGNQINSITFVWRSSRPDIAAVGTNSGLVTGVVQGQATISADVVQAAATPSGSTTVVVLDGNGVPMPEPDVTASPSALVLAIGEDREAHATVSEALSGDIIATPITWLTSVPGVISITPLSTDADVIRVTGAALGETDLTAQATVNGQTVQSPPIGVRVLQVTGGGAGPWTEVQALPYGSGIYGHRMSAANGHLLVTGGVTGGQFGSGFREDVSRARLQLDGILLQRDGSFGWNRSPVSTNPDPAVAVLTSCAGDPPCMDILREATTNIPERIVRYQVARHTQAASGAFVYVVGGIDAQVDLGIDPSDPGAVGPDVTRYSDRVLIGRVEADGTVTWRESARLPTTILPAGLADVAGRTAMAAVVYGDWLYATGGWGWVDDGTRFLGRNRDEVLRAAIDPVTGDLGTWTLVGRLPEPLNKHAAAVVGDWLLVSGGAQGVDENSPSLVSDHVYVAHLDPLTGDIIGGQWRETTNLPQALEYHAMVSVPGDPRVVVVGGDNPATLSANADAYMAELDPVNGLLGEWAFLPVIPEPLGLTSLAAAAVDEVEGTPVRRVYISGGGVPISSDVTDLDRRGEVYFIDLGDP